VFDSPSRGTRSHTSMASNGIADHAAFRTLSSTGLSSMEFTSSMVPASLSTSATKALRSPSHMSVLTASSSGALNDTSGSVGAAASARSKAHPLSATAAMILDTLRETKSGTSPAQPASTGPLQQRTIGASSPQQITRVKQEQTSQEHSHHKPHRPNAHGAAKPADTLRTSHSTTSEASVTFQSTRRPLLSASSASSSQSSSSLALTPPLRSATGSTALNTVHHHHHTSTAFTSSLLATKQEPSASPPTSSAFSNGARLTQRPLQPSSQRTQTAAKRVSSNSAKATSSTRQRKKLSMKPDKPKEVKLSDFMKASGGRCAVPGWCAMFAERRKCHCILLYSNA